MKLIPYILLASLLTISQSIAQCPYDNAYFGDLTPTSLGNTQTEFCAYAGDYYTVAVTAGESYTFSTCSSSGGDSELSLYTNTGIVVLSSNDDGCGSLSTITWTAVFTGVCHILIDEWIGGNPCQAGFDCYELSVTWGTALPVQLLNFDVEVLNDKIQLSWQTASEINNDFFTIERSTDGQNWDVINTQDGIGNSSILQNYISYDENPYAGMSYYRLKQTDFDENFSYSDIKSVRMNALENYNAFDFYPNPTKDQIIVTGNLEELYQIEVYNVLGERIKPLTKFLNDNDSKMIIDLSNLSKGLYFLQTRNSTKKVYKE